jgi:stage V sporulation protein R
MSAEQLPPRFDEELPTGQEMPANLYEQEDRELDEALGHIWDIAQEFHLDPFRTNFDVVPATIMNREGAYGTPNRYAHWSYGREYRRMKTMYDHGLIKIYELVINSDSAQAYLLENNPPIDNKFVMAHVLGHTDFFKNNQLFADTDRRMPDTAARHSERIETYKKQVGKLAVEHTLDASLAIEEHVNPYQPHRPSREDELGKWREQAENRQKPQQRKPGKFDELFDLEESPAGEIPTVTNKNLHIPPSPDRDVVGFIRNHAPYLEDWQRDILDIVRSESVYFYPQKRTKIMNEGWAAYWHKRIMREMGDRGLLSDEENEAWWKIHSGVVAPSSKQLNPYYLGMKTYEYLEDYYNGNLTEKEQDWLKKQGHDVPPHFDGPLKDSPALDKLRDVMTDNDDQSFIRNYFDKNLAARMNMYIYEEVERRDGGKDYIVKDTGWQEIRDYLADSMVNCGNPLITVTDGDHNRAGELSLRHEYESQELDPEYIQKTLPYLYRLWQRSVHLETVVGGKPVTYNYDGISVTKN